MKLLFLGYTESGKSTVAQIAADILGTSAISISDMILQQYMEDYDAGSEAMQDKEVWRARLFQHGRKYQLEEPAYFVEKALSRGDVVAGVRNKDELEAARDMFDIIIWVDREVGRKDVGDVLDFSDADYVLDNNGTLEQSRQQLVDLIYGDKEIFGAFAQ
jgi:dephospho-CoA kinase